MKDWKLTNWCNVATHKILYRPDREAVSLELRQHLDERCDSFLEKGMEEKEAVAKTLEVMGNPYELAVTLGKIHRPYWGFAYSIFKALSIALTVFALALLVLNSVRILFVEEYRQPTYFTYDPYQDTESEQGYRLGLWEQSNSDSFGGYTYKLEKCALWHRDDWNRDVVHVQIRVTNYLPWAQEPDWGTCLEAVDNLGNQYTDAYQNYVSNPYHIVSRSVYHTAPFEWLTEIDIDAPDSAGIKWIELRNQFNDDFVLRIDLTGGATQ